MSTDDSISTSICQDCFDHLEDFHRFYRNVDQKQKSLQEDIFDFLEVKCENMEVEDADKNDEIPVQDFLDAVQSEKLVDDDFTSNNENDFDEREADNLVSICKTEDYSTDG